MKTLVQLKQEALDAIQDGDQGANLVFEFLSSLEEEGLDPEDIFDELMSVEN